MACVRDIAGKIQWEEPMHYKWTEIKHPDDDHPYWLDHDSGRTRWHAPYELAWKEEHSEKA
jgi:hypothetical protein